MAEDDGEVIGFCSLHFRERLNYPTPDAWVPDLIVTERARRRGAARLLLEEAERRARDAALLDARPSSRRTSARRPTGCTRRRHGGHRQVLQEASIARTSRWVVWRSLFRDDWIRPYLEGSLAELPGLELFDVHTHIGENDPDGFRCQPEDLLAALDRLAGRAAVFAMQEPDGYGAANDRVLAEAERSEGRLVAFCRLDPRAGPLAEAERCLAAGAVGIKLHPRAEDFELATPALREVFALASERRLPVLVHAGRGIPALGRHAVELSEAFPGMRLILAHAGICDLAWIWEAARERPNLFFDTAWWSPADLLAMFTLVPPGQILFGSDAPYGTPGFGAAGTLRYARQAGLSDEQIRSVAGGQAARLVAGEEPLDAGAGGRARGAPLGSAARPRLHLPGQLDRTDVQRARRRGVAGAGGARLRRPG